MKCFDVLRKALELEREEEKKKSIQEIRSMSGEKRERLGRAVLNLKGHFEGRSLGGFYIVKFGRSKIIKTEIDVGDVVLISKGSPLKSNLTGTVMKKTSRSISVAFSEMPPSWVKSKQLRMDLYFNDITFMRMERVLERLENDESLSWILDLIQGKVISKVKEKKLNFIDKDLNDFQKDAVKKAVGAERVFLIHGPPGTGKTRTLAEVVHQLVLMGQRVAVSADSNIAVDNITELLIERKLPVVRIGHPARIKKELVERSLPFLVENSPDYKKIRKLYEEAESYIKERDQFIRPEPRFRRGLTDEEILRLAKSGKSSRGISFKIINSMARWITLNERVNEFLEKARAEEERLIKKVLGEARVVTGTNSSFGIDYMEDEVFDVLVHDEATQSTITSTLIPLIHSRKVVMAGDHKQLPPTILSLEAAPILSKTLFEILIKHFPEISAILRIQYRMNESIMRFPSEKFYDGKLIADPSVRNRTLSSLGFKRISTGNSLVDEVIDPDVPIVIVDTSMHPAKGEKQRKSSTSFYNPLEASTVSSILKGVLQMGVPPKNLGVITPYDDQVSLIKEMINLEEVEVSSVDGFQGREKEIIIISMVRSNSRGEIGFLEDKRRLNVAITRAKSKLILVGDFKTLSIDPIYSGLREYVKSAGRIVILRSYGKVSVL